MAETYFTIERAREEFKDERIMIEYDRLNTKINKQAT